MSTPVNIAPAFQSTFPDSGDVTKFGPAAWNANRLVSGGIDGEIVARDSTSPTGASWVAPFVATTRQVNGHALSADVTVSKADIGLGNVENTALSTWGGSANLTTVGPIALTASTMTAGSTTPGFTVRLGEGRACGNPVSTPTVVTNGVGVLTGVYQYAYYEADPTGAGTTGLSPLSSPITLSSNQTLVTVPLPRRGTGGRFLCRTKAGGSTFYYLANLNGFSFYQTIFPDDAADSMLTVLAPTVDTTVLYTFETNSAVKFLRTHPDQGGRAADLTLITGDPYTGGAYSLDCYGQLLIRAGTQNAFQTQTTGTGAGNYHILSYQLPAQNDGSGTSNAGTVVFSVSAPGMVFAAGNVTTTGYLVVGALGSNGPNAGDLVVNRGGASPGAGAIFFGNAGSHYFYFNGTADLLTDPIQVTGYVQASTYVQAGAASGFVWSTRSTLTAPANGQINLQNSANTAGIGFDFTTDTVLVLRQRGQGATFASLSVGGFGCNGSAAQTALASGGALASYVTGAFGLDSSAHMSALLAQVVAIRSALVANGIMS